MGVEFWAHPPMAIDVLFCRGISDLVESKISQNLATYKKVFTLANDSRLLALDVGTHGRASLREKILPKTGAKKGILEPK